MPSYSDEPDEVCSGLQSGLNGLALQMAAVIETRDPFHSQRSAIFSLHLTRPRQPALHPHTVVCHVVRYNGRLGNEPVRLERHVPQRPRHRQHALQPRRPVPAARHPM
jgi:hypothetical protein